jgi:hypothetical protein
MVFPYVVDPARKLVTVTMSGSVRGQDIAETVGAIYFDRAWVPGFGILYDARAITELLFDPEDMPRIVAVQAEHQARGGAGVDAILVTRALDYAMAQMYEKLARGTRRTVVSKSEAEAKQALGVG